MSTRWYPLYQKGNPQLRVFLPNFWMKLVKPESTNRKNVVQFHCSMEMTRFDIKNYLEKIYKVPVVKVNTRIALGKTRRNELNTIVKDDDIKVAYVYLPKNESFTFPDLFGGEQALKTKEKEESMFEDNKEAYRKGVNKTINTHPGLPSWFST